MKRSNDYGPQPAAVDNYKKPRFSPQAPYGYPMPNNAPGGYSHNNADLYQQFGPGVNVLAGMGGMAGLGSPQQQPSGGQNLGHYEGLNGNFFQAPYSPAGSFAQFHPGGPYHGSQHYQAATHAAFNQTMRTIYLGNLPPLVSYEEVINVVKGGTVEQVKILEEKNCAFITFVEAAAAHAFHADTQSKRPHIGTQEIKVGWGKHSAIPPIVLAAVQSGASRNVFIGNIDEVVTEPWLSQELGRFGPVDQIKILPEKRIAFVHMASIAAAMKAVGTLTNDVRWSNRRINYGKDRCAYQPKNAGLIPGMGYGLPYDPFSGMTSQLGGNTSTNRTVYLGSIHPDVTTKDLCDVIRGGILQNIKYMPDKNISFVTFVDPTSALNFYNRGTYEGVVLKGKRLKVGWGKATTIPQSVAAAVQSGASRNVYIGAIDDAINEERLRKDFSEFGDIELVNIIPEKNIGFVNFVDITSAVKAVDAMKHEPEYSKYKINFGKDRCGNPPRPPRETAAQRAAAVAAAAAAVAGPPENGYGSDSLSAMEETESLLSASSLLAMNTGPLSVSTY
ncbi:hypothetical protein DFS34DRAFT_250337 [Phlyctochytrium arcticum]|nr:hypothetical protein DFS34DRAFT_250337 [Phlyctochytrium arcticum]